MTAMRRGMTAGAIMLTGWLVPGVGRADEPAELARLQADVTAQAATLQQQQATIQRLMDKVTALEARLEGRPAQAAGRVSLEAEELAALPGEAGGAGPVLARPWFQNIRLDGFGAAGYVWTGGQAVHEHGSFLNYEATINVDAEVWEDVHYFHEIQTVRVMEEDRHFVRTREVYLDFKDLMKTVFDKEGMGVGAKLGRADIPFGEDYLTQDVIDNPLVTYSASFMYGVDEGVVLYGKMGRVNWIAALMDGNFVRGSDDNADKFTSLKLYGNPTERLYLSASALHNGETMESAINLGRSYFIPVGARDLPTVTRTETGTEPEALRSSLGASGSDSIDAYGYELDAAYSFGEDRYLKAQYGSVFIDDDDSAFDRLIHYFQIEPKWNLGPRFGNKWYLVGRFSAVGTFDDKEGYIFESAPYVQGKEAFGFDAKALYRWAVGMGYWLNPRTLVKVEYSRDDFQLITASALDDGSEQRDLLGFLVATRF